MRRSRRKRLNKKKAEQKQRIKRIALTTAGVVAVLAAADVLYLKAMDGRFCHRTSINGYPVSGKTVDEAVQLLSEPYSRLSLDIREDGRTELSTSFTDMGYTVDEAQLRQAVQQLCDRQNPYFPVSLFTGETFGMVVPFQVDEAVYCDTVSAERLATPRVVTADAQLVEQDGGFVIQPEVYGTDFLDSDLQSLVKQTIEEDLADGQTEERITVDIPKSLYRTPDVTQDSPDLQDTKHLYEQYCHSEIHYTFGEETVTLDWDTIRGWLDPEHPEQPIDEEAVYDYVASLADTYNTYGLPRYFETMYRGTYRIDYNNYGYRIYQDGEFSQLMEDIASNTSVTREPVYEITGYSRNGKDDLNGTYVEVDLSSQYLWFYKDGSLVAETPIISGLPTEERATHEGVFTIPYKQSPATLKGQGGGPGQDWDVEVQYWMPFDDGQGLHDATWQGAFGGTTYQYAGSHGCINLPLDAAATIYAYMEENVCIVIYS